LISRGCNLAIAAALGACGALLLTTEARAGGAETTRVSVSSTGAEANRRAPALAGPSMSSSGRLVAFSSRASNLVPGDTNHRPDVFVHDRRTGRTERASVSSSGREDRGSSLHPSISATGRFVAFESDAPDLVKGDHGSRVDVFAHDRRTGRTERVSVNWKGKGGNRGSYAPAISANGRLVAFYSRATNLVRGDTGGFDVFVHNRRTDRTRRVSVSSTGREGNHWSFSPSISATGRFVAFGSYATNLAPGDDNGPQTDVFVHDRRTGRTELVSVSSNGDSGNGYSGGGAISANGRFVAFTSDAPNLVGTDLNDTDDVDVFVHDRRTGDTFRVSVNSDGEEGNGPSHVPSISADGRFVAFDSRATNLVSDDGNGRTDVFVHDAHTGETARVSVSSDFGEANGNSLFPSISWTGRFVAFESDATSLVEGDTNERPDVFVRGPLR
jgi:Tol biopolymer transport system component